MAVAARVKPQDLFTVDEWARISARSSWRGIAMVVHAWAVIIAAGAKVRMLPGMSVSQAGRASRAWPSSP